MLTHNNAGARIQGILHELPSLGPEDVALHTAPISHFSGGINEGGHGGWRVERARRRLRRYADAP